MEAENKRYNLFVGNLEVLLLFNSRNVCEVSALLCQKFECFLIKIMPRLLKELNAGIEKRPENRLP